MNKKSLSDLRVLVTRAEHQQSNFIRELLLLHATPISFPLTSISITSYRDSVITQLQNLDTFDFVIFVSPNAVEFANTLINFPWGNLSAKFIAVGNTTRKNLIRYGQTVDTIPNSDYSSEGLLGLDSLRSVKNKRIAIISGNISRDLLRETLRHRGAIVEHFEVYQNSIPFYPESEILRIFKQIDPQIVCITSNQGILNLMKIVRSVLYDQLLNIPLVVNSSRCAKLAHDIGFKSDVLIAASPGDEGQLEALKKWYCGYLFFSLFFLQRF